MKIVKHPKMSLFELEIIQTLDMNKKIFQLVKMQEEERIAYEKKYEAYRMWALERKFVDYKAYSGVETFSSMFGR